MHGNLYTTFIKRFLDICVALLLLPFFALLYCIVAVSIKCDDGGPVFYKGERRGTNGQAFAIWKFRSMTPNAPDIRRQDRSTYNSKSDSRVTRVGHVIRSWSIDEVPQILNVLNGSMSIIGPRPNMNTTPYSELSDLEKKRLRVTPGITGLSQVRYRNCASSIDKYMADAEYVDTVSFKVDAMIALASVRRVLSRSGIHYDDTSELAMSSN